MIENDGKIDFAITSYLTKDKDNTLQSTCKDVPTPDSRCLPEWRLL